MTSRLFTVGILFFSLKLIAATNSIFYKDEVITYWNPPAGGLTIVENNTTNNMNYIIGRNYIKNLIAIGWTTNVVSPTNISNIRSNVFVPLTTQQWISIISNDGHYCFISIQNNSPIKIILNGAPDTFYKDSVDFSKKIFLRDSEQRRLERWSNNLDYRDGQIPVGAGGDPEYVNRVMNMRRQLNAEISNYKLQVKNFERNCELLEKEIQTAKSKPAYHHPKQVKAYFTGRKEESIPIWTVVR